MFQIFSLCDSGENTAEEQRLAAQEGKLEPSCNKRHPQKIEWQEQQDKMSILQAFIWAEVAPE